MRPDENIEEHVARLYNRIESPVRAACGSAFDLTRQGPTRATPVNRVYPEGLDRPFRRRPVGLVGCTGRSGTAKVVVKARSGTRERFAFPATFVEQSGGKSASWLSSRNSGPSAGWRDSWYELDLNGRNEELVKELVDLATRHGILTPYTSFMADETTNLHDVAGNYSRASTRLSSLSQTGGAAGTAQCAMKGDFQNAYQYSADNSYAPAQALSRDGDASWRLRSRRGEGRKAGGCPHGRIWRRAGPVPVRCRRPRLCKRQRMRPANCPTARTWKKRPSRPRPSVRKRGQPHLLSPPEPVGRFPVDRQAAAKRPPRQAIQQGKTSTLPTATAAPCRSIWPWTNR